MRILPALLLASISSAAALADPRVEVAPPVKLDGPPPSVTIVAPAQHAQLATHRTAAPDDKYNALDCLLGAKDRSIRIAVTDWPVKPNGPGVLVVVDGLWTTVVHDATKPINLEQLQPFLPFFDGSSASSPMSSCGWHWVAAVPTTKDGRIAPVEPAVSWYFSVDERPNADSNNEASKPPDAPLVIVNWPLVGAFVLGTGPNGMDQATGRVASTPDNVPLDYVMANRKGCVARFGWGQGTDIVRNEPRALLHIVAAPHDETLSWKARCDTRGDWSISGGQLKIYSAKPPASTDKSYAWPVSGKDKVDDNYFGENKDQTNQQIRRARCKDGHKESCD